MSLFSSILPCLLAAFALGALLGWALKSLFGDRKLIDLEESWAGRLRGKETEWETSNARFRSQLDTLQTDFNASSATIRAHEASLADWGTKYGALEASLATSTAELDNANATWNSKYSLLEAALAAKALDFGKSEADWKAKYQALELSLADRNKSYAALEADLGALKTSVSEKETNLAGLQARVTALEPMTLQAKDWEMKFLQVSDDKESAIKELQTRLSEIEPLRGQVKDWELKYTAILQERETETSRLRGRISELEPLSVQVNDWQARYQSTVTEKDETINSLRGQLSAAGAAASIATVASAVSTAVTAPKDDLLLIEGIGEQYQEKLHAAGVFSQAQLLELGATAKGRQALAESSGIAEKLLLRWVNHIDLIRIKGIGPEYAELLEVAGVDTVPELAQRNAENLRAKLVEVNATRNLVGRLPSVNEVTDWIQQAKELSRVITY